MLNAAFRYVNAALRAATQCLPNATLHAGHTCSVTLRKRRLRTLDAAFREHEKQALGILECETRAVAHYLLVKQVSAKCKHCTRGSKAVSSKGDAALTI